MFSAITGALIVMATHQLQEEMFSETTERHLAMEAL
tara:strand:+ start:39 stop:146 length:108 start_codon:yes stop_codon:yes gene_type:complete